MRRAREWTLGLFAIGIGALVLRLVYLAELRGSPFASLLIGDSLQFDVLARRIVAGDWSGTDVFYQAQMYPYFLAAAYSIAGFDAFAVRVMQACLGAASCLLLAVAGRHFFDPRTGLIAGGLLALYPAAIFFDGLIQKSSPDLFLMSILLVGIGACLETPRRGWIVALGVVVGLLAWNRENARVLYPVIAGWLVLQHRNQPIARRLQLVLLFTLGTAAILGPIALRNFRISGELLLTTSQFGPNFYIGNHAGASGGYEPLVPGRGNALYEREDAVRIAESAAGRPLTPSEVSGYWRDRAFSDIRQDPAGWLRLLAKKTWLTLSAGEPLDTESLEAYTSFSRLLRWLRWWNFGAVMALAVFGAWMTRRRWRQYAVLYAIFAVMAVSVIAFFVFARYRYPLVPVAMLFAAAGVASLLRVRVMPPREWLPAAGAAVAILVLLHVPITTSADETFVNYGTELLRQGRPADAIPLLREAVRRDPDHPRAHLDLALALQQTNQDAVAAFDAAIRLTPNAVEAHAGRAIALHRQGRLNEALESYGTAAALKPDAVEILSNYGVALAEAGRSQEALAVLERGVALQPRNVPIRLNLCRVIGVVREPAHAIPCYRGAVGVSTSPQEILEAQYALGQAYAEAGRISEAMASLMRARAAAQTLGDGAAVQRIEDSLRLLDAASRR